MKLKGSKIKHFAALPNEKLIDEVVTRAWNFRSLHILNSMIESVYSSGN